MSISESVHTQNLSSSFKGQQARQQVQLGEQNTNQANKVKSDPPQRKDSNMATLESRGRRADLINDCWEFKVLSCGCTWLRDTVIHSQHINLVQPFIRSLT